MRRVRNGMGQVLWREELRAITGILLDGRASQEALGRSAVELRQRLSARAVDAQEIWRGEARTLPTGLAIAPRDAVRCIEDSVRTAMYLRGVAAAVAQLRGRFKGELEVVYAGTGPLAPLVLPLLVTQRFAGVRVTFIDINEASIESVRRLVEYAGNATHRFVVADATAYKHDKPIHLVITETMQRALAVEPQVAIAANLAAQLCAGGLMVPECVRVDLCIASSQDNGASRIGTIVELSRASIEQNSVYSARTLTMPHIEGTPCYSTSIQTHGTHRIRPLESGLTMPECVWSLTNVKKNEVITFWYESGERPGIRHRRNGSRLTPH